MPLPTTDLGKRGGSSVGVGVGKEGGNGQGKCWRRI